MTNHFDSKGGEQNIAQGDHAIGKQENNVSTSGDQSPAIVAGGNVTVNYGLSSKDFAELAGKLAVTEAALASFFKILEEQEQQVPLSDLDAKLREIATQYKELLARVGDNQAAKQAIDAGDYAKAEELLEDIARHHSLAAAKAHADNARLQDMQLRYAKAAAYWQKAAALLPDDEKQERALCLNEAGYDLHRIAKYKEALPLYEQSLSIRQEIGDRAGEGATLNNISGIYSAQGDYGTALNYLEQSLSISREIGDRAGEGTMLNNISQIYSARGDYTTALKYYEQSLAISREIGDRAGEAVTSWNIGCAYEEQGDLAKAEQYISRAVQLAEEIGHPKLKDLREALEDIRAKLKGR